MSTCYYLNLLCSINNTQHTRNKMYHLFISNLFQNCVILLLMNLWLHLINHKYVTRVVLTLHCGWRKIRFLPTTEETFHLYLERLMKMERRMHHHNGIILHNIMLQGLYKLRFIITHSIKCHLFLLLVMGIKIAAKLEPKMVHERKIKNHRNLRCAQQNVRMILLTTKVTTALHFLRDIEGYYTIIMNIFFIIYLPSN